MVGMSYQMITKYNSPNFTNVRISHKYIVIHWWGDPATKPTFEGVISTLCNPSRDASAHYVAEAGRVACLVDPDVKSWATGPANSYTISIECNPRQSDADYETIGELIRDLRKTYGDLPLKRHRDFMNTACPGTYDLARLDRIARGKGNTTTATTPANPSKRHITVDGYCGAATIRLWQQVMGTPVDGIVSGQVVPDNRTYGRASLVTACVRYGKGGSTLIKAVQKRLGGLAVDGYLGHDTIIKLQRHLGVGADGWFGPATVKALQTRLNTGKF
mgnify:CR=1 FL=1